VEESDTVTFKTVVSLETTPPGIATSPQEADEYFIYNKHLPVPKD
jgi:hypothetical protein